MSKFNHVDTIIKIALVLNRVVEAYKYQNNLEDFKSVVTLELSRLSYNAVEVNDNGYIIGCINAYNTVKGYYGRSVFSNTLKAAWDSVMDIIEPDGLFDLRTKKGWLTEQMLTYPYFDAFKSIIK